MKVTVNKIEDKKKGWNDVRVMKYAVEMDEDEIIVLTNGNHEGGENGSFEGTVLYNSNPASRDKVGKVVGSWSKRLFKEVDYLNLSFSS